MTSLPITIEDNDHGENQYSQLHTKVSLVHAQTLGCAEML